MKSIILDVDTGIDDAMAIVYAARSPELKLLGVTTTFGNVSVEAATRNTLHVLELLGRDDVPVSAGADRPLIRPLRGYAKQVHGEDGLGGALRGGPKGRAGSMPAARFMTEMVRRHPGEVTIIAVGPMTNLAQAVILDPAFAGLVGQVIIMGGAVTVRGNITPYAEANIHSDPEAAAFVLRSGLPLTMVGLDVTMKTLLPRTNLETWRRKGSRVTDFLAEAADFYMNAYENWSPGIGGCALHDPLAVGMAIDPSFCRTETMHVGVVTDGDETGRTVGEQAAGGTAVNVCLEVEADRFLQHFMSRIA